MTLCTIVLFLFWNQFVIAAADQASCLKVPEKENYSVIDWSVHLIINIT